MSLFIWLLKSALDSHLSSFISVRSTACMVNRQGVHNHWMSSSGKISPGHVPYELHGVKGVAIFLRPPGVVLVEPQTIFGAGQTTCMADPHPRLLLVLPNGVRPGADGPRPRTIIQIQGQMEKVPPSSTRPFLPRYISLASHPSCTLLHRCSLVGAWGWG